MNPELKNLPPPPKGQTGISLDQFKHLPPPPKGQKGLTLDQIELPATVPVKPEGDTLSRVGRGIGGILGGSKIGEAIGTQIAKRTVPKEQQQFVPPGPSGRELAGDALQIASNFIPVGRLSKGIATGAKALGLARGVSAVGKIGAGLATGAAVDVAQNLQEGRKATDLGLGTALGGAIPAAGVAKNMMVRFGERQAPRIINSLIKPLAKDFSYGKNPGRAIAEENIVANNFEDLATKINQTRHKIGQEIDALGNKLSTKPILNIRGSLSSLDEALKQAAAQNNPTLLDRLGNVKDAITNILEPGIDDAGKTVIKNSGTRNLDGLTFSEARQILGDIGDMTQFTGNPSDDKLVNSALKRIYGSIKEQTLNAADSINPTAAKRFRQLTEKYADLTSAEVATKYRDKIASRSNLVGLSPQIAGIGTGLITLAATGGAATPAILLGLTGGVMDKLMASPAFKTRLASVLSKKAPEEVNLLFRKVPALQKFFPKGSPVSPGDRLLQTEAGQKLESGVKDYIADPKIGMSIKDVTSGFKNIKGDDLGEIMDFIDDVGGKKEPNVNNAIGVRRLAQRYGINPEQSDAKIASTFRRMIDKTPGVRKSLINSPRSRY